MQYKDIIVKFDKNNLPKKITLLYKPYDPVDVLSLTDSEQKLLEWLDDHHYLVNDFEMTVCEE